jgi:hypothetical protein
MTVRKEDYPLEKITLKLREGDFKWLQDMFPENGAAKTIRKIIIAYRKGVEAKAEQRQPRLSELKINLEEVL